ncbi:DNA-binding transcriptional regulator, MarR family [Cryobacterium flavum]|uniref:DNA-binding transcriptional regulator, MarR family n=1 Tax=Cryobacterium flavum TaxID=1424659 RepID=A0A4V3I863_9MICO|nr:MULTISPECIES: MarR family transcriptional regulator [Cryobacterium]TFB73007.1 MarR family transcriptional regulator [Cryobacterium flavum]SDN03969.1 DNA-binding transcriptional regulator, MarR family [Cryobacterium flavum]
MSHDESNPPAPGTYWYDPKNAGVSSAMEVLRAVRRFRVADAAMRHRAQAEMQINETDLMAIRHLIACERQNRVASPKDLSEFLNISSAATAKLLSRLTASGHIRREVNPDDGRAQRLFATSSSHEQMRQALSGTHEQLMQVAVGLAADHQAAVVHFLDAMSAIAMMPHPDTVAREAAAAAAPGGEPASA